MKKIALLLSVCFLITLNTVVAQEEKTFVTKYDVKTTPVKNQSRSGTCWAFAGISFVETELLRMEKGEYDLSEMYIVRNVYPIKADNYIRMQGKANFSAGGQGHDVLNAIKLSGFVPESVYPGLNYGKDYHDHSELDDYLSLLTKEALSKRLKSKSTFSDELIIATLDEYLGSKPKDFTYNGNSFSAKSFFASTEFNTDDYIEITSYNNYPYYANCVLQVPDNWSFDSYLNVPLDDLMTIMEHALKNGYSICWDGDVSGNFDRKTGLAQLPDETTEVTQKMRQTAFDKFESTDDHLMHITGLSLDENGRKYYITKNSWGTEHRYKGFWYMSEQYLRMNTVAILVHKEALPEKIIKEIDFMN